MFPVDGEPGVCDDVAAAPGKASENAATIESENAAIPAAVVAADSASASAAVPAGERVGPDGDRSHEWLAGTEWAWLPSWGIEWV